MRSNTSLFRKQRKMRCVFSMGAWTAVCEPEDLRSGFEVATPHFDCTSNASKELSPKTSGSAQSADGVPSPRSIGVMIVSFHRQIRYGERKGSAAAATDITIFNEPNGGRLHPIVRRFMDTPITKCQTLFDMKYDGEKIIPIYLDITCENPELGELLLRELPTPLPVGQ